MSSVLVVDVGTSGVRAAVVHGTGEIGAVRYREVLPETPMPNFVQFDAGLMARSVMEVTAAAMADAGTVDAVGIANQRASTIVWDRATGEPVGPGVGWQDLRTVGTCLALRDQGHRVAPNASATKLSFLLDMADPDRSRDLCFGTVDTWVAWHLSGGSLHVIDATNAGVTGLLLGDGTDWNDEILAALNIPRSVLPTIVDSSGVIGEATAVSGSPPIAGIAGDQQASLIGQSCVEPGQAKITFGTGGMLDMCGDESRPSFDVRGGGGCFPIIARRIDGRTTWGVEAVMLSAGTAVEWLRDDLGLVPDAAATEELANSIDSTGDVWFVPALMGLGTPDWDFGARAALVGLTRGTGRAEIVRAVLEGVAHRGADLAEAAETDGSTTIERLRVDGGMAANGFFVQALANACQRPVEVSPVLEATTLGAAYLAGLAVGVWSGLDEIAGLWSPAEVVTPTKAPSRERWKAAVERSKNWVPELSSLDF
ncbi:MAG: FGGY family carbohydrate kinase [Acidimicrobiales bacterium]